MNTKESLELVYLRLITVLKTMTAPEKEFGTFTMTQVVEVLLALEKIQYLMDMEEDEDDLPNLMSQVPAPGSEQA